MFYCFDNCVCIVSLRSVAHHELTFLWLMGQSPKVLKGTPVLPVTSTLVIKDVLTINMLC